MKQIKKLMELFVFVFLLVLVSNIVSSYGVAPSSYNYDYEQGQAKDLTLRVLNNHNEDLTLFVFVEDSGVNVSFSEQRFALTPNDKEKTIHYSVELGDDPTPGLHEISIKVLQIPNLQTNVDVKSLVNVVTLLVQKVNIFVPYDGVYLQGSLYAKGNTVDSKLTFLNRVVNKGSEEVIAEGYVVIKGATNQEITRIDISPTKLVPLVDSKIQITYPGLKNAGLYYAETHLFYEDKELVLRDSFLVGESNIEATSLDILDFKLGKIVKISFDLRNNWNQEVKNIYGDVSIIDENGKIVSEFKTNSATVSSHGIGRITGYWDTENLLVGTYQLLLNLNYDGKTTKQMFEMVAGLNSVNVLGNSLSGNVLSDEKSSGFSKLSLLIILVILLFAFNAFIVMKLMKKKR